MRGVRRAFQGALCDGNSPVCRLPVGLSDGRTPYRSAETRAGVVPSAAALWVLRSLRVL